MVSARVPFRWPLAGGAGVLLAALVVGGARPADPPAPAAAEEPSQGVPGIMFLPRPREVPSTAAPSHTPVDSGPGVLQRPLEPQPEPPPPPPPPGDEPPFQTPVDPPLGFAGPSGVRPTETQESAHFVPVEDRWRIGFPEWNRYAISLFANPLHPDPSLVGSSELDSPGIGQRLGHDVPYELGRLIDPYNLNVFKGDYALIGQNTFLDVNAISRSVIEGFEVPTPQNGFDTTARPGGAQVFGRPNHFTYNQFFSLSADLFHGDAAFKPVDWRVRVTPVFNINALDVEELGIVSPDVRAGTSRNRTWFALEEWFVEGKLTDLSPQYDFLSVRAGSQFFNNDFRGFLFTDTNRAIRIFGTELGNRDQFNLIVFKQLEKDTDSGLNTFQDRHQVVLLANNYFQDFIFPGYTAEVSVAYDSDRPTFHFNKDGFLVRPDPAGAAQPHGLDVVYLGWAGDGHIGRVNLTHQFYWALGRDSLNPIAGQGEDINAQFFALELSYDRDWARFRTSFLWASGDSNPNNGHATGFDTIDDNPNFAGGDFSFWQRQEIKLLGVNLVQQNSLVPDLRASKFEGQANFVNPGLLLVNAGVDFELTPKLRSVNNFNFLWFDETAVLDQFVFQKVHHAIGADLSTGLEYRPLLSNNVIIRGGVSTLIPGQGFKDLYSNGDSTVNPLVAGFLDIVLAY